MVELHSSCGAGVTTAGAAVFSIIVAVKVRHQRKLKAMLITGIKPTSELIVIKSGTG